MHPLLTLFSIYIGIKVFGLVEYSADSVVLFKQFYEWERGESLPMHI